MGMPALGVGHRQPAHRGGAVAVLAWPQQKLEVVGHEAVRQQSHIEACDGLLQDPLERGIVVIILEDRQSRISPVEGRVDQAAFHGTSWS